MTQAITSSREIHIIRSFCFWYINVVTCFSIKNPNCRISFILGGVDLALMKGNISWNLSRLMQWTVTHDVNLMMIVLHLRTIKMTAIIAISTGVDLTRMVVEVMRPHVTSCL